MSDKPEKYKSIYTWLAAEKRKKKTPIPWQLKRHKCDICGSIRQARFMVQAYASGNVDDLLAVSLGLQEPDPNQKYKWECGNCEERKPKKPKPLKENYERPTK